MKYEYDKSILITGVAGFIGSYVAKNLLSKGCNVVGIDNLNDYYSVNLKRDRLKMIENNKNENYGNFAFYKISLEDEKDINETSLFKVIGLTVETRPDFIDEEDILYFVLQSLKSQKIKPEKSKLNYIFNHKLLGLQDFTKEFIKEVDVLFNSDDKTCDYIF